MFIGSAHVFSASFPAELRQISLQYDSIPADIFLVSIKIMLENASPLPVKAAGGVRNYADALEMIQLDVQRIGTSGAKAIIDGITTQNEY